MTPNTSSCFLEIFLLKYTKRTKMVKKITDSTEWGDVESYLSKKISGLKHEREIKRMIRNIQTVVTQLSKAEVEMRRGRSNNVESLLNNVNEDAQMVEEYILVAALI